MKLKLSFLATILSISLWGHAQQEEKQAPEKTQKFAEDKPDEVSSFGRNELKLNLFSAILSTVDLTYERIFKDNTALGVSAAYGFFADDYKGTSPDFLWSLMPHYRLYFGKKQANGFFIEANAHAAQTRDVTGLSYTDNLGNWISETNYYDHFGIGAGFAVGAKFLTAKGLSGEVFGGAGRYLNQTERMPEVYPRVGVAIGKRF